MEHEIIFSTDNFVLLSNEGIGANDTPYKELRVVSRGIAEKHVVEVRLDSTNEKIQGDSIQFKYFGAYVSHGMRMRQDSLSETREYIQVLEEAVSFAEKINSWLNSNEEWQAR